MRGIVVGLVIALAGGALAPALALEAEAPAAPRYYGPPTDALPSALTNSATTNPPDAAEDDKDIILSPQTRRAMRESGARMDGIEKRMDERVQRATRSICAGCIAAAGSPGRRPTRHASADDVAPVGLDPDTAPIVEDAAPEE